MNISAIITAVVVVAGLGLLLGLFLGAAGIWFKVDVDEKEQQVLASLPGTTVVVAVIPAVPVWRRLLQKAKHRSMPVL